MLDEKGNWNLRVVTGQQWSSKEMFEALRCPSWFLMLKRYQIVGASCTLGTGVKHAAKSVFQLTKQPSYYKALWLALYLLIYFQTLGSEISRGSWASKVIRFLTFLLLPQQPKLSLVFKLVNQLQSLIYAHWQQPSLKVISWLICAFITGGYSHTPV